MHEGKHGILDGVDDIDDLFGTKKEEHEHDEKCEEHKHEHDEKCEENKHEHGEKCEEHEHDEKCEEHKHGCSCC